MTAVGDKAGREKDLEIFVKHSSLKCFILSRKWISKSLFVRLNDSIL